MNDFKTIDFKNDKLILIDQTKLPLEEVYIETDDYNRIAESIEKLEVRGAPAIGVAAAYAVALSFKNQVENNDLHFQKVYERLRQTRPTAVNLFWSLDKMKNVFNSVKFSRYIYIELLSEAKSIHQDDIEKCEKMAANGLEIFDSPKTVLTHCNAGQLATGGGGTALYVIINAFRKGLVKLVYADETRPLLQGSRLTAFELEKANVPFKINTDSTAAMLMSQKKIDMVITGADRIAANGDAANKIGTYNLAVLCSHHKIPFYIVAPTSTIDTSLKSGKDIIIEERSKTEITKIKDVQITKDKYEVYAPAFDVTPNHLITAIITEKSLHKPPYKF
ncbi:MAG: S-methyl-5-thioribose-1-phosphate isomerase [Melioribacteraceae bacterium]|nr:MAG: S-methyl-5-thioribose-1-phosphate isomerase [Melioribacteraceae bacterium]